MKKGQSLGVMIAVVIGSIVLISAIYFFSGISNSASDIEITSFKSEIKAKLESDSARRFGTITSVDAKIPEDVEKICFADPLDAGRISTPLIRDSAVSGSKDNVFIFADSLETMKIENLLVCKELCFDKSGFTIKGTGKGVMVVHPDCEQQIALNLGYVGSAPDDNPDMGPNLGLPENEGQQSEQFEEEGVAATSSVTANEQKDFVFNSDMDIEQISIIPSIDLEDVQFSVAQKVSFSTPLPVVPFKYFEITKSGIENENIKSATIKFSVPRSWLLDNNLQEDSIALYRFTTEWTQLPTTKISSSADEVQYSATTPGFSVFGIGGLGERRSFHTDPNNILTRISRDDMPRPQGTEDGRTYYDNGVTKSVAISSSNYYREYYDDGEVKYLYRAVEGTEFSMISRMCANTGCEDVSDKAEYNIEGSSLSNMGQNKFRLASGESTLIVSYTEGGVTYKNRFLFRSIGEQEIDIIVPEQNWPDKLLWHNALRLQLKFIVEGGAPVPSFSYSLKYGNHEYTQPPWADTAWMFRENTLNLGFSINECGKMKVVVNLNPDRKIPEKDYSNNVYEKEIEIDCTTPPYDFDMTIEKDGTWPIEAIQGQYVVLKGKFKNIGTEYDSRFSRLYHGYSKDPKKPGHGPICVYNEKEGVRKEIHCPAVSDSFSVYVQPTCGDNNIVIKVDGYDDVLETDEANNEISGNIFVDCSRKPDLIIEKIGNWPDSVKSGSAPIMIFVMKNIGTAPAYSYTTIRMCDDKKGYIGGYWTTSTLDAGSSTYQYAVSGNCPYMTGCEKEDWSYRPNCAPGTKVKVRVCADDACCYGASRIEESDESNNILIHEFTCE